VLKYAMTVTFICLMSQVVAADPSAANSAPASQTQLERLERQEAYEKAMEAAREVEVSLDAITRARKFKCLKAFGNQEFCECLNSKLAVGLDFDGYIAVITRSREELKYDTLSTEDKALVDSAVVTRNACAK
jgi:hypothetical protein